MTPFLRISFNPPAVFFKARRTKFDEPMLNPTSNPSPLKTPPLKTQEGRGFLEKLIKLHDQLSSPQRHREHREKMFVHPIPPKSGRRLDERPIRREWLSSKASPRPLPRRGGGFPFGGNSRQMEITVSPRCPLCLRGEITPHLIFQTQASAS